jgi:predicted amidohydrolase
MSRPVSIAACNFNTRPVASFDEFAGHVRSVLDGARGADIVLLPELFTIELWTATPGWETAPASEFTRLADFTDDYQHLFETEAAERDQYILAGSHLVREQDGYRNVAFLYGPEGLVHAHAKTHIFPAESDWGTGEGDEMQVVELPFAKVGVNICYEAEIPELSASLTEQGAEIILCPSFTFSENGFWRVRHCAAARAIENQVYFVHCCTGGSGHATLPAGWARSSILSPCDSPWDAPNGVVAEATANEETVARAVVDVDLLYENRENGAATTFRDRRRRASLYAQLPSHVSLGAV